MDTVWQNTFFKLSFSKSYTGLSPALYLKHRYLMLSRQAVVAVVKVKIEDMKNNFFSTQELFL